MLRNSIARNAIWQSGLPSLRLLLLAVELLRSTCLLASATSNNLSGVLQTGLFEEEANHNLKAAIQAYQSVVTEFDDNRKLAATAIFRLGECYRKLGNTNEALAQYERVLREFSDQAQLVALSRQNSSEMGSATQSLGSPSLSKAARQEQKRLLQEEIKLVEAKLADQQKQVDVGVVSRDSLRDTQRELLGLKRQMAALDTEESTSARSGQSGGLTATEAEEVQRIQAMIKDSPDLINAPGGEQGQTPLEKAAEDGQLAVAQFLLANGAVVERPGARSTPLRYAAANGHNSMVELLLAKGANVNAKSGDGKTALHEAAARGFNAVIETLLSHGADVNSRDSQGRTPLFEAVSNKHADTVGLLLANKADPNAKETNGQTPLFEAVQLGRADLVQLLLGHGAEVNVMDNRGATPLQLAVKRSSLELVELLLAHGAEVDARKSPGTGPTPLDIAVESNQKEITEALLKHKADPDAKFDFGQIPIRLNATPAPGFGRLGGFAPGEGYTPLLVATLRNEVPLVELLLDYKADPNLQSAGGRAPIFNAIESSATADRMQSAGGRTPRFNAIESSAPIAGRIQMVKLLLDHGAAVDVRKEDFDNTPLISACYSNDKDLAELLLAHKANPNATNSLGYWPLLALAALSWDNNKDTTALAEVLLAAGADPNQRDGREETALDMLNRRSEPNAVKLASLLRQHGAMQDLPRWDQIEVRRPASGYRNAIFQANDWNQFTLLELIAVQYDFLAASPNGNKREATSPYMLAANDHALPFPKLARVTLRRPVGQNSWEPQILDLADILASSDCYRDVPLKWGDVVEIPEADHPINAVWNGFSAVELQTLKKCLTRQVKVVIKGKTTVLTLAPDITEGRVVTSAPFWIKPVLLHSDLLLSSSDLSRVKVKRKDPQSGQEREWILDCSASGPPAFWLRDGDVIEVPDKP